MRSLKNTRESAVIIHSLWENLDKTLGNFLERQRPLLLSPYWSHGLPARKKALPAPADPWASRASPVQKGIKEIRLQPVREVLPAQPVSGVLQAWHVLTVTRVIPVPPLSSIPNGWSRFGIFRTPTMSIGRAHV